MPRKRTTAKHQEPAPDESAIATRSLWSGTISFGLVSVPVHVFPAVRSSKTSLRMLAQDGTPLARRYYCSKHETHLDWDELVRGYEIKDDEFVIVTDQELEALAPHKSRDIDLTEFVDEAAVDAVYFERPYFLAPGSGGSNAYRLLADAMERTGKAGIASFVMRGTEYLVAIVAENGVLRAQTLRFANELRSADEVRLPKAKKANQRVVKNLKDQIQKLAKPSLASTELKDEYSAALVKLAEKKRRDKNNVVRPEEDVRRAAEGAEVVDLLEILKKSLRDGVNEPPGQPRARSAKRRAAGPKSEPRRAVADETSAEELYERAKSLGVEGRSKMSKRQLATAVRKAS